MAILLNERIRTLRENRKITQADMAVSLGMSRLTYIAIETGDKQPTVRQIETVAAILSTTPQELLFPENTPDSERQTTSKYRQMCLICIEHGSSPIDGRITKTKLAKLLYLVDFSWFAKTGQSMSGLQYRALPRGPVADLFFQVTDDMFESGLVEVEAKGAALLFSINQQSDISDLSSDEQSHIKTVCDKWRKADTQKIVDFTHEQSPWMLTKPGMYISYELVKQIPQDQLY